MKKKPIKIRHTWGINPKTQVKPNDKAYDRKRDKDAFKKDLKNND